MTNVRQKHGSVPDLGGGPADQDLASTDSDSDSSSDKAAFQQIQKI